MTALRSFVLSGVRGLAASKILNPIIQNPHDPPDVLLEKARG